MASIVNRETIETFIEACGGTNFKVVVRGVSVHGQVNAIIEKKTQYRNQEPYIVIWESQTTGLRSTITPDGVTRTFHEASNFAKGDDWVRTIAWLVESKRYHQVEMRPLESISSEQGYQKDNPAANLEPLIWRCEDDGTVTTHGGAREGAGRPSLGGKLISFDAPLDMIDALKAKAETSGKTRAELIRTAVEKMLAE